MIIKRGEIWFASLNPIQNSEQASVRPAPTITRFTTAPLRLLGCLSAL